jgi:AbrB family looped-hinge helix DNA binding protein
MPIVKTSSKGQIVIPRQVRETLGIHPGTRLLLRVVGGRAELVPLPDDPVETMRGMMKGNASLADELLNERADDEAIDEPSGS